MKKLPRLTPTPVVEGQFATNNPHTAQAELFGCPIKLLYLADEEYQEIESYKIHPFKDLQVKHLNDQIETIKAATQFENIPKLLESLFENKGQLIVINSYPGLNDGYTFLWHLACQAGRMRLQKMERRAFSFSFVGSFPLEEESYQIQPRHVIAYGPCLDEFDKERVCHAVNFILRFTDYTRILLVSTSGVCDLLTRLRVIPSDVAMFFNICQREGDAKPKRGRPSKKKEVSV